MGFREWLQRLFGRRIVRDISRLDRGRVAPGETSREVVEEIPLESGPLKPGHRRRIRRDPRLLPKRTPILPRKRPKVMSAEEAGRLFAGTLRTTNRQLRDLLPDLEQLARYGLPAWETEAQLAEALGLTVGQLRHFSIHREAEQAPHYVTFAIPKRSGGERLIHAPKKRLKALQRKLNALLVEKLPVSPHAHGFRKGRSIRSGAAPHVGQAVVVKLDLADFFPTVTYARVRGLLIALGYGYPVAATLAVLMTEAERQPVEVEGRVFHVPVGPRACVQGAPTSPGLCNAVTRRMDHRLGGLARKLGFTYTRYADDLAFSGPSAGRVGALIAAVTRLVEAEGFRVNPAKTRVSRKGRAQRVTGVTVNQVLGLSRKERRRLRAEIHQAQKADAQGSADRARDARIEGKLAYLQMLNPEQAAKLRARWRR